MFKKNKKKETETEKVNPFHRDYGILSDSLYILKKIWQYFPFLLVLMAIGVVTNSLMQYLWSFIGKFVIDLTQAQAANGNRDIMPLLKLLLVALAIELVSMLLDTITNNKRWYYFIYVRGHMITERVAKVLSMPYQVLEQPDMLDMHQKASRATEGNDIGIEGMMYDLYNFGVRLVVLLVTSLTVAVLDWRLIIVMTAVNICQSCFFLYTSKRSKKEVWDRMAPVWRKMYYMERCTQDFDYAKDIRLFSMQNWLSDKQHEVLSYKQGLMFHLWNLWRNNGFFGNAVSLISIGTIQYVLIYGVLHSNMSIGDFTLYLGLTGTFSITMVTFLQAFTNLKRHSMEVDDYRSFLDIDTEEQGEFLPLPETTQYKFEFRHVSFQYKGAENYALKDLNLTMEPEKKLAVVGLNGAGKTTFIKLLLRLYEPTEGEILLNGTDIRRFRRKEYYNLFAPVFQNVELFAFPMCENVAMKSPEETDKVLAEKCLVQAGLAEKIAKLPKGIDTEILKVIDDEGIDLSGGEKQKLALARALYKDSPVIVLDEPTAALDAIAEYNLYKNFDEMIGEKSAVYISHRLSSTRFCDAIAMFKAGKMVEYGTHEDLLAKGGAYAEMYEIQAQYYKEGKDYAEITD